MRTTTLVGVAIAFAILAAACTKQTTPPDTQGGPIAVGKRAPAFSLTSANGTTVSLSDFAGKPLLLYFSMGPG